MKILIFPKCLSLIAADQHQQFILFWCFLTLKAIDALLLFRIQSHALSAFSITAWKVPLGVGTLDFKSRTYRKSKNRLKRLTRSSASPPLAARKFLWAARAARSLVISKAECIFAQIRSERTWHPRWKKRARRTDRALIRNARTISHARSASQQRASINCRAQQ